MMRTETFEAKVKETAKTLPCDAGAIRIAIDPMAKRVNIVINEYNSFMVSGVDLGSVYEHALRILRGYGPKPTRVRTKKEAKVEATA